MCLAHSGSESKQNNVPAASLESYVNKGTGDCSDIRGFIPVVMELEVEAEAEDEREKQRWVKQSRR